MIHVHVNSQKNEKVLNKVSKKFNIDKGNVTLAAYETFLFTYLFALAIKDKKVYVFATDESGKKSNVLSTYNIDEVVSLAVENKTDLNLFLTNGKFINLTSIVGVSEKNKRIVNLINEAINASRY